jgi:hypothetical protein
LQTDARLEQARGASGGPSTLQWNAEAITLAGRHLLRAPVANRAYMLLSVAEARSLDALGDATGQSSDTDNGVASRVGALAGAAVAVLTYVFPTDQAELDAMLAALRQGRRMSRTSTRLSRSVVRRDSAWWTTPARTTPTRSSCR